MKLPLGADGANGISAWAKPKDDPLSKTVSAVCVGEKWYRFEAE